MNLDRCFNYGIKEYLENTKQEIKDLEGEKSNLMWGAVLPKDLACTIFEKYDEDIWQKRAMMILLGDEIESGVNA